jgi:hypothetical protein
LKEKYFEEKLGFPKNIFKILKEQQLFNVFERKKSNFQRTKIFLKEQYLEN